jgi:hypothetical protein
MTLKKMWELQHKLDKERLDCPRCGEPTAGGNCRACVLKEEILGDTA